MQYEERRKVCSGTIFRAKLQEFFLKNFPVPVLQQITEAEKKHKPVVLELQRLRATWQSLDSDWGNKRLFQPKTMINQVETI